MNGHSNVMTDTIQKRYFSIGEVSKECMVPTSCIRFWEDELGMKTARIRGNARKYSREQVAELMKIAAMRSEGFTLKWLKTHGEEKNIKSRDLQFTICE